MISAADIQPTLDALVVLPARAPIAIVAALARHAHRTRPIRRVDIAGHSGLHPWTVSEYLSAPNRHLEPLAAPFRIHRVGEGWRARYHLARETQPNP